jgi:putative restriction endonuclease
MARGVFLHRPDSIYDDRPDEKYQFPKLYLDRVAACVGDWIIYYEPGKHRTARRYFAVARVEKVTPDPSSPGRYLALIEPGSYLPFERDVPFRLNGDVVERDLLNEAGGLSARQQWAVRPISIENFNRILDLGMPEEPALLPRTDVNVELAAENLFAEGQAPFLDDPARQRVEIYSSRIVRDRIFRKLVLDAYDCRCAITGLRFINGGGRAEVQGAHIKPVEAHGPDIVSNGLALSGTVHWMFDRGLISLSDDLDILVSRQVNDVDRVWELVNETRRAMPPPNPALRPHPRYLTWHRNNCFKQ